ncbi:MAG: 3-octaprenyl-4-hydroxybenzoate decarboxylase, partial [Rhodothalassiaceae bacterium]
MDGASFRDFLAAQEAKGEILRIGAEIDTLDEIGAFIARADYAHVDKGLLFENPKGFDIPVFANTIGTSYRRIAETYGVPEERAVPAAAARMREVMQSGGVPP